MIRKKRAPPTPIMDLQQDSILQTQKLTSIQVFSAPKNPQQDQINQNKKFLTQILKYSNLNIKLPNSVTSRSVEEALRSLNIKLASIASEKKILADYQKHFRALNIFFKRVTTEGEKLPKEEEVIWKMFFLNNMAVIAFNNGDYTTSMDILKTILEQHRISQTKQPVFTLAITNLSAIYHKMNSKVKCFEFLQNAFEYSKKLLDNDTVQNTNTVAADNKLNSILAIQCIMMIKHSQSMQMPTHNISQIEKLMIKLVKDGHKASASSMDIPYIDKYLEEKKLTEIKELQSSIAGSVTSSRRSKSLRLQPLNNQLRAKISMMPRYYEQSDETEINDSPVKRYSFIRIRQQIDELNTKVTRLQLQNSKIETTLFEILDTLKKPSVAVAGKETETKQAINNLENALDVASRAVFKTLQVFISFYDQGVKLKTFNNEEEKLSWGELENIFKLLDLFHIYFPYLQLNPTKHTIAWIISKYLRIENTIKIKKQPWPILTFEHDKRRYGLYHIRQREFTIFGPDISAIVFEMSQKSFNYYFNSLKNDQYQAWSMCYFDQQPYKLQQDYYLQVIQLKTDVSFQQDIQQIFTNFKTVLHYTRTNLSSYKKVKLWFDQSTRDDTTFFGVFYLVYNNLEQSQLQYNLYPLNNYDGIQITEPTLKIFTYNQLQSKYSMTLSEITEPAMQYLYMNLADAINIRIQSIKKQGKIKYVVHGVNYNPQCIYFQQRMILKKYYKPIFIYILRTKTRYISIRFSYYNEAQILTQNINVVLNMYIPKKLEENSDEIGRKFVKIKGKVKTDFLSRYFGQLEKLESGNETRDFIHVEELIRMIEAETKNWGQ